MTTETSNARGDVPYDRGLIARMLDVCGHPKFTLEAYMEQARLLREGDNAAAANVGTVAARGDVRGLDLPLIACMLGDLGSNDASTYPAEVVAEQISAIEALAAEGVQAGAARAEAEVDALRVLLHEAWGHVPSGRLADQIHVALTRDVAIASDLAAEGVQAGEVVELRRQLYLLGGERDRYKNLADRASEVQDRMQRAIDEARSQQPEARGVVGGAMVDLRTHRSVWRSAIHAALEQADPGGPDRSFWLHELNAFDRTFAALTGERNG